MSNNTKYVRDAFKSLELVEDKEFDLFGKDSFEELGDFIEDEDDVAVEQEVIDLDAEEPEELKDSYVGDVILGCPVCHTNLFKAVDDVVIDEETDLCCVGEACPVCGQEDGFKVIGKVAPFEEVEEEEAEVEVETEPDEAEVEVKEKVRESFRQKREAKKLQEQKLGRVRKILKEKVCKDCGKEVCECDGKKVDEAKWESPVTGEVVDVPTFDVTDQVIVKRSEPGFISKMHALRDKGYKCISSGDGQMCFAKPKELKTEKCEALTESKHDLQKLPEDIRDIVGEHFDYTMDFDFLDVVADILLRVDDFEDVNIWDEIDSALIYTDDQWRVLWHYVDSPEDLDSESWSNALETFGADLESLCGEIAEARQGEEEEVEESLTEDKLNEVSYNVGDQKGQNAVSDDSSKLTWNRANKNMLSNYKSAYSNYWKSRVKRWIVVQGKTQNYNKDCFTIKFVTDVDGKECIIVNDMRTPNNRDWGPDRYIPLDELGKNGLKVVPGTERLSTYGDAVDAAVKLAQDKGNFLVYNLWGQRINVPAKEETKKEEPKQEALTEGTEVTGEATKQQIEKIIDDAVAKYDKKVGIKTEPDITFKSENGPVAVTINAIPNDMTIVKIACKQQRENRQFSFKTPSDAKFHAEELAKVINKLINGIKLPKGWSVPLSQAAESVKMAGGKELNEEVSDYTIDDIQEEIERIVAEHFEGTDFFVSVDEIDLDQGILTLDVSAMGSYDEETGEFEELNRKVEIEIPSLALEDTLGEKLDQWMADHSSPDWFYESIDDAPTKKPLSFDQFVDTQLRPKYKVGGEMSDGSKMTPARAKKEYDEYLRNFNESLNEAIENATIETEDQVINLSAETKDEDMNADWFDRESMGEGELLPDGGEEMIAPLDDADIQEIEDAQQPEEEPVEETEVETETEVEPGEEEVPAEETEFPEEEEEEVEEVQEESFKRIAETYLKKVYSNVKSFEINNKTFNEGLLTIDGTIEFNSGKKKTTTFVFEAVNNNKTIAKSKKEFVGLNETFTDKKDAFVLATSINDKKLVAESLSYDYPAKTKGLTEGVKTVKGIVK